MYCLETIKFNFIKYIVLLFLLLFVFNVGCKKEEIKKIKTEKNIMKDRKTITLYITIQKEKISYEIIRNRLKEAFKRNKYNFILKALPAKRALLMANTVGDGDAFRVGTLKKKFPKETKNLIKVSFPIYKLPGLYVYVLKDNYFKVNGWNSLKQFRNNGYLRGIKIIEKDLPNSYPVNKVKQLFNMLAQKRIDTLISRPGVITDALLAENNGKIIQLHEAIVKPDYVYTFLHKKHKDLIPLIAKSLEDMMKDGTYDKIEDDLLERKGRIK